MSLRPARDGDSDALVALVAEAYADYPGCLLLVAEEEPELLRPGSAYAEPGGWWVVEQRAQAIGLTELRLWTESASSRRTGSTNASAGTGSR